jgi:hypothetical protein
MVTRLSGKALTVRALAGMALAGKALVGIMLGLGLGMVPGIVDITQLAIHAVIMA